MCAATALPLLALCGYLLFEAAQLERAQMEMAGRNLANNLAGLFEREMAGLRAMIIAFSRAPSLHNSDLSNFERAARQFAEESELLLVLRTPDGKPVISVGTVPGLTASCYDGPPDRRSLSETVVTDLAAGCAVPAVMVHTPVIHDGELRYLLTFVKPVAPLENLLGRVDLPARWWACLLDSRGVVMTSTLAPGTIAVPQIAERAMAIVASAAHDASIATTSPEGEAGFAALHRIAGTPWVAAVAAPRIALMAPAYRSLGQFGILAAAATLTSIMLAALFANRVTRHFAALSRDLADAEEHRGELLAALGRSPVFVRDLDGRILFWGAGAEDLFGFRPDQAMGQKVQLLLSTRYPADREAIQQALLADGHWEGQLMQHAGDGREIEVSSHWLLQRARGSGAPHAVVEVNVDMSAEARARREAAAHDQAVAASRDKTAFLAAISHDLRQPFQALRLFHQILDMRAGADLAPVVDNIGKVLTSGEELLDALADLSVLETGAMTVKPTYFAIGPLLDEIVEECAPAARAANLVLRAVPCSVMVRTDRGLLRRMIRNLVTNAIRYTREGGVLIGCRRRGDHLRIQVLDTGIGIPADKLARIFEEFFQVGSGSARRQGLGLGLAIVSRLSNLLELPVTVTSTMDRGSVFTIEAPIAARAAAAAEPPAHALGRRTTENQ